MGTHKLVLDDDFEEDFSLIAIHCSEEPYKVAYILNQFARLKLRREKVDLAFTSNGMEITLPLFGFEDHTEYTDYSLVANKCKSAITKTNNSGGLFGNTTDKETVITYLIPELKKVDYFLKIQSDFDNLGTKMLINQINDIKQIISAYQVAPETLKSKDNLIFD
ncbi:IPExxxVDY family protein [Flavobacteriaceae bacterium]|nr:IPExxxVDY family protein [Flavobacteriaceae bacterium]MDB9911824.1 IPExxxVDY family protein [Flavobacteriaceae bacterium]